MKTSNDQQTLPAEELLSRTQAVLHLDQDGRPSERRIRKWLQKFDRVTLSLPEGFDGPLPEGAEIRTYQPDQKRTDVWNEIVKEASTGWVFFLHESEEILFTSLPEEFETSDKRWIPVRLLVSKEGGSSFRQYYHMRLVPATAVKPFSGKNLPDTTNYIYENEITLAEQVIDIRKRSSAIFSANPDDELSERNVSPKVHLLNAEARMGEKKYAQAAAQYRRVLRTENLLPFDRLAAVNGLAGCLTEQFKWPQAVSLAETSLEAEPLQRIPYLIQYRIHQLNKQWREALNVLKAYNEGLNRPSRASFDRGINEYETLLSLADLASKAGDREESLNYYEQIYAMRNGEVDRDFLKSMLILSLELSDFEKSVCYFEELYRELIPEELTQEQKGEVNDYLGMFMAEGWFEYCGGLYRELYKSEPNNPEYRRRLIVTFSKTDKIDEARDLIEANL